MPFLLEGHFLFPLYHVCLTLFSIPWNRITVCAAADCFIPFYRRLNMDDFYRMGTAALGCIGIKGNEKRVALALSYRIHQFSSF